MQSQLTEHLGVSAGAREDAWVETLSHDEANTFRVLLHDIDNPEPVNITIEASSDDLDEVSLIVEQWVEAEIDDIRSSIGEEQAVQMEIDRRRGK